MPVNMFKKGGTYSYFTVPYNNKSNVLLTTNNDTIKLFIATQTNSKIENTQLYLSRAISEEMNIDLVVLLNWYCDIDTQENVFDIYYVAPAQKPITIFRSRLLEQEFKND
jgi:hypothetical protein